MQSYSSPVRRINRAYPVQVLLLFCLVLMARIARADQFIVFHDGPFYTASDSNSVALLLENTDPRQALQLTVRFDPELLVFRGAKSAGRLIPDIEAVSSDDGAGVVRVLLFDDDAAREPIQAGADQIVDLIFGLTLHALPETETSIAVTAALAASNDSPPNLVNSIGLASASIGVVVGVQDEPPALPFRNELYQNAPNPFNPSTAISFEVAARSRVRIRIYDLAGRLVASLFDQFLEAGAHAVTWTGRDGGGRQMASGLYFYRLDVGDFSSVRKMTLLK